MKRYDEYKDSGVQWLGEIPGHWKMIRIKALFDNIREKNNPIQTDERLSLSIGKGVTLYSEKTTNLDRFKEDCSQYLLAYKDDIVLNSMNMIVGAVGKSNYFGCVSPAYYVVRLKDKSNKIDFYSHLLNIQKIRDVYRVMGKGIMAIDRGDGKVNTCRLKVPYDSFASIKVPLPSVAEQTAIVNYLDEKCRLIDKMIEGKERQIELLAEVKQRVIADAVTRGLNPDVKMKATNVPWLQEIPEHWRLMRLKCLFNQRSESYNENEQLEVLSLLKDVGVIPYSEKGRIGNKAKEDYSSYNIARKGDIVMNSMNVIIGSVDITKYDGYISPAYYALYAKPDVSTEYYNYIFHLKACQKHLRSLANGILEIRLRISTTNLFGMYFPVPPISEQRAIVEHINGRVGKIDILARKLKEEIEAIKEYKQRLISDVVTGQIKVC